MIRLSIDLQQLALEEFTSVFKMYFNSNRIEKNEVVGNGQSASLNVFRIVTNVFADYSRTIINFHK